jgi:hypothetical protein
MSPLQARACAQRSRTMSLAVQPTSQRAVAPTPSSSAQEAKAFAASDTDKPGGVAPSSAGASAGGHMGSVVKQALQSMGVSLPADQAAATGKGRGQPHAVAEGAPDSPGTKASSQGNTLHQDLNPFLHAMIQAVNQSALAQDSASSSDTPDARQQGDRSRSFASGLSTLQALQSAFDQLMSDLQNTDTQASPVATSTGTPSATAPGAAATGSGTTSDATPTRSTTDVNNISAANATTATSATSSANAITLQDLLDKVQQRLGYGSTEPRTGRLFNATA